MFEGGEFDIDEQTLAQSKLDFERGVRDGTITKKTLFDEWNKIKGGHEGLDDLVEERIEMLLASVPE